MFRRSKEFVLKPVFTPEKVRRHEVVEVSVNIEIKGRIVAGTSVVALLPQSAPKQICPVKFDDDWQGG